MKIKISKKDLRELVVAARYGNPVLNSDDPERFHHLTEVINKFKGKSE